MKRSLTALMFLAIFSFITSCASDNSTEAVEGDWTAFSLIDKGTTKDITDNGVSFKFNPNGTYEYKSSSSYREAGNFRLKGKYLYTTDTLAAERLEKSVKLALITPDSLYFDMNDKGAAQTLKLRRE